MYLQVVLRTMNSPITTAPQVDFELVNAVTIQNGDKSILADTASDPHNPTVKNEYE